MADSIKCPECRAEIPLSGVISHQIEEQLAAELAQRVAEARRELIEAASEREDALKAATAEREEQLLRDFAAEREAREARLREQAETAVATELADLRERSAEQDKALTEARERELALLQQKRQLDERAEGLALEVARQVEEERQRVAAEARQQAAEQHQIDLRKKDIAIEQMQRQITELKESSEQARAGLIGEAQEREIEDVLGERFRSDVIQPVKAGQRGADVLQSVMSRRSENCGKILWESKRAQNWSGGWIPKLKEDQAAAGADVAVLVCSALPRDVRHMELIEGVWVVSFACVTAIATSLREALISVSQARSIDANRNESGTRIYDYVTSGEFSRHVRGIIDNVVELKDGLDSERRSMERIWAKRAKQIEAIGLNTAGIYGDLEAVAGAALPAVEKLELPAPVPLRSTA
jgi:hypothetical protein